MNIPLILNVLSQRRKLLSHSNWSPEKIKEYQKLRLKELREYAYKHSDFYKEYHKGYYDKGLEELPTVTKSMMMENFDSFVTDKSIQLKELQELIKNSGGTMYKDKYWISVTSGTSGNPGIFLTDIREWSQIIASYSRSMAFGGLTPSPLKKTKMAMVSTTFLLHQSYQLGICMQSPFLPTLRIDATEPLKEIISKLNKFQPEALVSYASMTALLAQKQMDGDLKIHPKAVFTSSEVLTSDMRNRIKDAWGMEPFNQYAATEPGGLGSECKMHQGVHLFNDLIITEVVDENNKPVPPGTYGNKLLLTVLFSRTLPLIRYQLNDSIKISNEKCSCGLNYPLIEDIQGRSDQIVYLKSRDNKNVAIHPVIFYNIMDRVDITQWQVFLNKDEFIFSVIGNRKEEVENKIVELTEQALLRSDIKPPAIKVQYVNELQRNSRGKLLLIINNL